MNNNLKWFAVTDRSLDQKNKEVQLQVGSREWFERVIDAMEELVLVKGPRSRLLWANKAFCDYYGMTKAEVKNIVDGPQVDPDDTLQYVKDDMQVFRLKKPLTIPSEPVTKFDGSIGHFQTVKTPVFEDGEMVESVGVSRELQDWAPEANTERDRNKILTSALRGIVESFPIPMLLLDGQLRVVKSSPLWSGYFCDSDPGNENFLDCHKIGENLVTGVRACLDTGDLQEVTLDLNINSLKYIFKFEMSQWSYPDGDLGGVTIVAHDITEISESRLKLESSNERYALVAEGSSVGIWDWKDITSSDEFWSPRFYQLLGYRDGEIEASIENFQKLLHPDDQELTFQKVEEHFKEKSPFDVEYRLKTKSGQFRWFRGTGQASFNGEGTPMRMVGSIQDIHDKKIYEEELKASNEELDQFAYIASHDLREPLRGMRNFSGFLMEDYNELLDETGKKYLQTIQKLGMRLENYLDSLLLFSRLGREKMAYANVDLKVLLSEVAEISKDTHMGIDLAIELPDSLPSVFCDPAKLTNIVGNLFQNAVRYNTSEQKKIKVSYQKIDGGLHQISVSDNGIGIRAEHKDLIFSLFKRLHGKDEYGGGTGMGLTLVKKAVERHGGKIWLESLAGEGSTFYFTFKEAEVERKLEAIHSAS